MAHPETTPARALSDEEAQERAEAMFALDQQAKSCLVKGREAMWELAGVLHEFDEEAGWSALDYDSLGDWLADPEIGMTRRTYTRFVNAHRDLVVNRQVGVVELKQLDVSKVEIVMGKVRSGAVKLDVALSDVKALGARDLREKYMGPDPADKQMPDDSLDPGPSGNVAPCTGNVGLDHVDDGPVLASDVVADVIEGTAVDLPTGLWAELARDGWGALAMPQRLAGSRQAVREAFEAVLKALDDAGLTAEQLRRETEGGS
jgi:hypothetical protein